MSMIEVKTADLIGPALDWAVDAIESGKPLEIRHHKSGSGEWFFVADGVHYPSSHRKFSTDWRHGGPLIHKFQVGLLSPKQSPCGEWHASTLHPDFTDFTHKDNPLIAAMRAIVASELGDAVQVPAELVNGSAL